MRLTLLTILFLKIFSNTSCQSQSKNKMESKNTNPLLCDIETGMCEMPGDKEKDSAVGIAQSTKNR